MTIRLSCMLAAWLATAWLAGTASAATYYWSGSGTAQGGSGTWGTTLATFGTAAAGPYDVVWSNDTNAADTVIFGGFSGTATLDTEIAVRQITLNNDTTIAGTVALNGGTSSLTIAIGGATNRAVGGAITASLVGTGGLTVTGSRGPLVLGAANTFAGTAAIGAGSGAGTTVVRLDDPAAIPTTANLNLRNGVIMLTASSGNFSRGLGTGVNQVQINGGGGFAASGSNRSVSMGVGTVSWNGTNAFAKTSVFILGNSAADSTVTFTNALNLSGGSRVIQVDDGTAAVDAVLSGQVGVSGGTNGNLTKVGLGTLALTASSLLSGSITVNAGTLQLGNSGTTGSLANAAVITVGSNGRFATSRTDAITQGSGFRGIVGAGGFTHAGTGTTTLTAVNTYAGPTAATAGTLRLAAGASIDASRRVTVDTGAVFDVSAVGQYVVPATQTLGGSGTIAGSVSTGSGATISPGTSPGTLTFAGDLSWNASGNYNWQMLSGTGVAGASDSWDLVSVTGGLTISASSVEPFRLNLWTLAGTAPDVSGSAANFDAAGGYSWTIATAAGGISGFAADKFAVITSATNGTGGFANPFGNGTFSVAQSGNDLNLIFTAGAQPVTTITVASGTQTQTQAGYPTLSGSTPVVKAGSGTLVLDQANPLTGSTTVQGGVLQLANGSALSASRLVVVAGGTGQVAPQITTSVAGLDLATGNGLVDLTSGGLTILGGITATELVAEILEGRADGSWSGASGITSSTAAAGVASNNPRAVGWLDNGDGSLTAAYAAPGDTNIDWSIDILDASNFLAGGKFDSGMPAIWFEGDFSYDGIVDILDAADFFATGLYDAGNYNTPPTAGVAAVPEPKAATLIGVGAWLATMVAGRRLSAGRRSAAAA
jgi:fibronectin-binding autotransporter adhesin